MIKKRKNDPVGVYIIGRVNVGKSTLFNRLIRIRNAIVEDTPGVTRDHKDFIVAFGDVRLRLVDTGGIDPEPGDKPGEAAQRQTLKGIETADFLIFVVDIRAGCLPGDLDIAAMVRKSGKPVILVANKAENEALLVNLPEFTRLGLGDPVPISAEHNLGITELMEQLARHLRFDLDDDMWPAIEISLEEETSIAIVGRPNVGKSSLINAILNEEKHIVTDVPGTTRESIDSIFCYKGKRYRFIDTAGLRRIGRMKTRLEKVSAIMTRRTISFCDIGILVIDAGEGFTAQDAHIAGTIIDAGKGCIVAVNKWDLTERTTETFKALIEERKRTFPFMTWTPFIAMSAKTRHRVFRIFPVVDRLMDNVREPVPTTKLNKVLSFALKQHPPPKRDKRQFLRFYYATQIERTPPTFLIFCNTRKEIHFSYRRYLINTFREAFGFEGWPIRLVFRHRHEKKGKVWT